MTHPGDLLSAYFDDELSDRERGAVAVHIESCGECQHELAMIQSAAVAVRSLPSIDPPPDLAPAMSRSRKRRRWQAAGVVGAGATALVAMVIGVGLFADNGEPTLVAADTVPVALEGIDPVPAGDASVSGQQRVQALSAAFQSMDTVEEMDVWADDMYADADVVVDGEPMKVKAGMWDGVAADYIAIMIPTEGIVGLFMTAEEDPMAFFYCDHSWYRVEGGYGHTPPLDMVVSLRSAVGCES